MKILKYSLVVLLTVVVVAAAYFVYGLYINPKSPKGMAEYSNGATSIQIRYYRPFKNERLIFSSVVSFFMGASLFDDSSIIDSSITT